MSASQEDGRGEEEERFVYLNRPVPRACEMVYAPPPAASNPVLRGLPLYYLSQLVVKSSLVQSILYSLNGFARLRDLPALRDYEPRYLPNVIRAPTTASRLHGGEEGAAYLAALSAEDWHARPRFSGPFASAWDYAEAYRSGAVSPVDVVEALLPLVRGKGARHATAFLCVRAERVREAAEASAERWAAGKPRSLMDGVVVAVKDEVDVAGHSRSLGTKMDYANEDGEATSFCVRKWMEAGAICLGKTTMHEMGLDTTNNNPNHGTPVNPYHPRYYCGGSSGGSAYAVAAGLVPIALGNDGGGSIRIPAAYCGLFGLKPTHGRVSLRPTATLARSTGVAGPLAASMLDCELAYRVMAAPDPADPESGLFAPPRGAAAVANRKKVIAICRPWFDRADAPVRERCQAALDFLRRERGYSVVEISLPLLREGQLAHALTIMSEILSGISASTLTHLTPPNQILLAVAGQTRSADFLQAQKLRALLMAHLAWLFETHGRDLVIATPSTPNAGWAFAPGDERSAYGVSDGNMQLRNMEYAYLANLTGNPALGAPVGYLNPPAGMGEGKVPVGLMGMGDWGAEDGLLAFGYDVEAFLHSEEKGGGGGRQRPQGEGRWVDALSVAGGKT